MPQVQPDAGVLAPRPRPQAHLLRGGGEAGGAAADQPGLPRPRGQRGRAARHRARLGDGLHGGGGGARGAQGGPVPGAAGGAHPLHPHRPHPAPGRGSHLGNSN